MEPNYFRDRLFDLLNDSEGLSKSHRRRFFTGELAGTGRILRRGQNHREMPAGAAYYY